MSSYFLRDNRDKFDTFKSEFPQELFLPLNMGRYIPRTTSASRLDNSPSYSVKLSEWITWAIEEGIITAPAPVIAFTDLSDVPSTYGTAGQLLRVNATTDGLEYFTASTVTDTSIYKNDGILTGNRAVDLGGFDLSFGGIDTSIAISPTLISFTNDVTSVLISNAVVETTTDTARILANTELDFVVDTSAFYLSVATMDLRTLDAGLYFDNTNFKLTSAVGGGDIIVFDHNSAELTNTASAVITNVTNDFTVNSDVAVTIIGGDNVTLDSLAVNVALDGATGSLNVTAPDITITGSSTIVIDTDTFTVTGISAGFPGVQYFTDYSADYNNRSLVDKEYVDGLFTAPVASLSIEGAGTIGDPFILVNDEASPGNWHYYGVDGISNKGWHLLPQFAIQRNAVPSSTINAQGGDSGAITETAMQDVVVNVYEPLGLAQPGTIFNTIFSGASDNPTYQASGSDPYNPSNSWFWDGEKVTRIKELLIAIDLEDTLYGGLGTAVLTPIVIASPGAPTDAEVATWIETNYTNNGLRLPNGAILYLIESGTISSPDFVWQVIDDISDETGVNWEDRILKRIKEPVNVSNFVDLTTNQSIGGNKTFDDPFTAAGTLTSGSTATFESTAIFEADVTMQDAIVYMTALPTYINDAAAGVGGLTAGRIYKTASGELRIKI